ncbi:MAG TPA: SCO family protein [Blastocatellia bacterium]|nr:SCO family protein [Blastocatellia bacterium]
MNGIGRREMIAVLGMAPFAGALLTRASARGIELDDQSSREMIRDRYFPNILLTTHEGKRVRFYDDLIKDKIVMINLMYADCEGSCPIVTTNLTKVQKALGARVGREIFMYSITLKPEQDTPRVLKEYAKMHGVKPGWSFLTGDPKEIELLRRKLGFTNPDPKLDADKSQHIGMLRYGNEPLQQWAACPGRTNPSWIVKSVLWVDWPRTRSANRGAAALSGEKGERR